MIFGKSSLADYFFNSRHALNAAKRNNQVYALLSEYNMTTESIDVGLAKLDAVMAADKKKTEARGKQYEARTTLEVIFSEVHPLYMSHVLLTKAKCQNNIERVGRLMLMERRKTRINDWLLQSDTFYTNLVQDTEMLARLETNSISLEKITAAHDRVKEVEKVHTDYIQAKGIVQVALEARDLLLDEFDLWLKEFITICKIALRAQPQLLEILGIQVLSKGYVRTKSDQTPGEVTIKSRSKKRAAKTKKQVEPIGKEPAEETQVEPEPVGILQPAVEMAQNQGT